MYEKYFFGGRRSGKTTRLIAEAKKYQEAHPDKKVIFSAPAHQCNWLRRRLLEEGVDAQVVPPSNLLKSTRGNSEYQESNLRKLRQEIDIANIDYFYTLDFD
jgi:hypothetical protein